MNISPFRDCWTVDDQLGLRPAFVCLWAYYKRVGMRTPAPHVLASTRSKVGFIEPAFMKIDVIHADLVRFDVTKRSKTSVQVFPLSI